MSDLDRRLASMFSRGVVRQSDVRLGLEMPQAEFYKGEMRRGEMPQGFGFASRPLPGSDEPTLKTLLEAARQPTWRVWALDSPYDLKDLLKARGYGWNDGSDGHPKSWYRDVPEADLEAEKAYLQAEIYSGPFEPHCVRMTALTRYSDRV